jgi:hypothetical protein
MIVTLSVIAMSMLVLQHGWCTMPQCIVARHSTICAIDTAYTHHEVLLNQIKHCCHSIVTGTVDRCVADEAHVKSDCVVPVQVLHRVSMLHLVSGRGGLPETYTMCSVPILSLRHVRLQTCSSVLHQTASTSGLLAHSHIGINFQNWSVSLLCE